nr:helix-turn-helix domain-containing protein [Phreatobacter cathodiphilus]
MVAWRAGTRNLRLARASSARRRCCSAVAWPRIGEYIDSHYGQAITLDALAGVAEQSSRTVWRSFMREHGMTPQKYIRKVRLEKARNAIIQRPDLPIMQIGLMCGFNSLGFFAKSYKEVYGELPSETRARS